MGCATLFAALNNNHKALLHHINIFLHALDQSGQTQQHGFLWPLIFTDAIGCLAGNGPNNLPDTRAWENSDFAFQ